MRTFYKRFRFWAVIIVIVITGFIFYRARFNTVSVRAIEVKKQHLEITVTATSTGTVKAEEEVRITAQRQGRITNLYVEEGDRVKAGDMIAMLDVFEVEANLRKAEAAYVSAEARVSGVAANISKTKAQKEEAEKNLQRMQELYKKGIVPLMEVDSSESKYEVAKANYDSAKEELKFAEAQMIEAKAARDLARLHYNYSFIKTPIAGVVSTRPVEVGDMAAPGPIIATVVNPETLYIKAPIDEVDVDMVKVGQAARVTMDAYLGKVFYGRVIRVSPIVIGVKQETRTFEVRVSVEEKGLVLKPGMSADIEIITGEAENTLVVPTQSVMEKGKEKFVFVIEGNKAKQRKVAIGVHNWNFTEIKEGIKEGEKVIITPDKPGLKEGVSVKIVD
ncbi:MAG: efflux RND transporter periplasmic adaptor subunit [Nitrospirae bacterium]|nr:efflux RND transporter periplasmic adaptor subunit [Nitrospirota bacterium]